MKFKILASEPLFESLTELYNQGQTADQAARDWITNHFGEAKRFGSPHGNCWGGIAFIELAEKPEGWKSVGDKYQKFYAPKASNKEILEQWEALPCVKTTALKTLLNYGGYYGMSGGGFSHSSCPGITFCFAFILVETASYANEYIPEPGMIEILESEFNDLKIQAKEYNAAESLTT